MAIVASRQFLLYASPISPTVGAKAVEPLTVSQPEAHCVGVVIFAVVVNKETLVHELTPDKLRSICQGRSTNWKDFNGADLPIRMVSRKAGSGTRRAFQRVFGIEEPDVTSDDCMTRNSSKTNAPVIRCEVASTEDQLRKVDTTPGAIGYAEVVTATKYSNLNIVQLNRSYPDIDPVKDGRYSYWAVEYLYTYGSAGRHSLRSSFLTYMDSDPAKNILRRHGITPCVDRQEDLRSSLCRP